MKWGLIEVRGMKLPLPFFLLLGVILAPSCTDYEALYREQLAGLDGWCDVRGCRQPSVMYFTGPVFELCARDPMSDRVKARLPGGDEVFRQPVLGKMVLRPESEVLKAPELTPDMFPEGSRARAILAKSLEERPKINVPRRTHSPRTTSLTGDEVWEKALAATNGDEDEAREILEALWIMSRD